ncbi:MAG: histidine kinase dimerization/phospho-acceptor domain-containing protein, partial [Acidobacteriota bacterium]
MAGTESIEVRGSSLRTRRRLVVAAVVFALFVVFDIGLFAFLIFDSLSQRELEKVLLEAEAEARPIASELLQRARDVGADELLEIVTVDEQTETWIDQRLDGRRLVSTLEIRDADGNVIYAERREREATAALAGNEPPRIETGPADAVPELSPREPLVQESVEIPIGELGTLTLGLDESAVRERIGLLRRDLIRQTSVIGALTLVLLAVALIAFVVLLQRSRRLEDQAREAERMAYVGTLASGLAHEIRSPLNSLSLNMQMLEEEARETGESTSQASVSSRPISERVIDSSLA